MPSRTPRRPVVSRPATERQPLSGTRRPLMRLIPRHRRARLLALLTPGVMIDWL
jgi:hypothetical protein